jgi:DNA-binding beta-propeller fold protein YncE
MKPHKQTKRMNIMNANKNRTRVITGATTAILGMALAGLISCSSGESTSNTVAPGGSAGLQGPLVFVHGTDKTTSVIALRGDTGNSVIHKMGAGVPETGHPDGAYDGNAPGDMQFSEGEWVFVNVGAANGVALIDPLSGAKPIFKDIVQVGSGPAHIYRDPTDGQVMWTMLDAGPTADIDNVPATIVGTNPPVVIDCSTTGGGAVTILHNAHIPSGGRVPEIIGKVCLYAKGHKVTAFSRGTSIPKRAFVSSEVSGEIAVIDNEPTIGGAPNPDYLKLINRIDLCDPLKELPPATCDSEVNTPLTTAFTPNNSSPHGIRYSIASNKVYSIQEGYRTITEIDPALLNVTRTLDLTGTSYTSYGITPDGKYLFLRGVDTVGSPNSLLGKTAIIDLVTNPTDPFVIIPFNDLQNIVPGTFRFAPDGKRLYMLASNTATGTGAQPGAQLKNILLEFNTAGFPAQPQLLRTISLEVTAGNHGLDIYADGPAGAGSAKYVVVSNGTGQNSVSIINATDNSVSKQNVPVGAGAGTIMIYYPDAALNNNQASS